MNQIPGVRRTGPSQPSFNNNPNNPPSPNNFSNQQGQSSYQQHHQQQQQSFYNPQQHQQQSSSAGGFYQHPGPQNFQGNHGPSSSTLKTDNFQFYQSDFSNQPTGFYNQPNTSSNNNMMYQVPVEVSYLAAFGTGGLPGEPPLLEELGINITHIWQKTFTVLNPMKTIDQGIMEDADLWGPFLFCLAFGAFLLLSGKVHFSYIYGLATLGWLSIYGLLNLMSETGIDMYRTASVLGYCLLPMVLLSSVSILLRLRGFLGYGLGVSSILWCTYASSGIFTTVLGMKNQRILVAYPVGLLYACFALITIF